jgi:hypothetical protein
VRLHFFTRPVYLLSHPDYVDQVLGKKQHSFAITRLPKRRRRHIRKRHVHYLRR